MGTGSAESASPLGSGPGPVEPFGSSESALPASRAPSAIPRSPRASASTSRGSRGSFSLCPASFLPFLASRASATLASRSDLKSRSDGIFSFSFFLASASRFAAACASAAAAAAADAPSSASVTQTRASLCDALVWRSTSSSKGYQKPFAAHTVARDASTFNERGALEPRSGATLASSTAGAAGAGAPCVTADRGSVAGEGAVPPSGPSPPSNPRAVSTASAAHVANCTAASANATRRATPGNPSGRERRRARAPSPPIPKRPRLPERATRSGGRGPALARFSVSHRYSVFEG